MSRSSARVFPGSVVSMVHALVYVRHRPSGCQDPDRQRRRHSLADSTGNRKLGAALDVSIHRPHGSDARSCRCGAAPPQARPYARSWTPSRGASGRANTAYGHGLLEIPQPPTGGGLPASGDGATAPPGSEIDNSADDSGTLSLSEWLRALNPFAGPTNRTATDRVIRTALQLPFPIHISRLRADTQAERGSSAQNRSAPQRFASLSFDDPGTPTDQMPSFSPKLTSGSVELILANILDTLQREHITTVVSLPRDTRDKLFLAQQISRALPAVTLFTIESDLLFVHPDYNSYARGMIVASKLSAVRAKPGVDRTKGRTAPAPAVLDDECRGRLQRNPGVAAL